MKCHSDSVMRNENVTVYLPCTACSLWWLCVYRCNNILHNITEERACRLYMYVN